MGKKLWGGGEGDNKDGNSRLAYLWPTAEPTPCTKRYLCRKTFYKMQEYGSSYYAYKPLKIFWWVVVVVVEGNFSVKLFGPRFGLKLAQAEQYLLESNNLICVSSLGLNGDHFGTQCTHFRFLASVTYQSVRRWRWWASPPTLLGYKQTSKIQMKFDIWPKFWLLFNWNEPVSLHFGFSQT